MKIPFWLLPVAWGLKGKSRLRAEADYYYSGEELDRELAVINNDNEDEKFVALLEVDLKYNKINQYEFDKKIAEHNNYESEKEKETAMLGIELTHNKITKHEFDRKYADLNEEPYVNVIKMDINEKDTRIGFFELDWNEYFVNLLIERGYKGASAEDIVNKWMNDICRTILIQEGADQDYGLTNARQGRPDVEIVYTKRNEDEDEDGYDDGNFTEQSETET